MLRISHRRRHAEKGRRAAAAKRSAAPAAVRQDGPATCWRRDTAVTWEPWGVRMGGVARAAAAAPWILLRPGRKSMLERDVLPVRHLLHPGRGLRGHVRRGLR